MLVHFFVRYFILEFGGFNRTLQCDIFETMKHLTTPSNLRLWCVHARVWLNETRKPEAGRAYLNENHTWMSRQNRHESAEISQNWNSDSVRVGSKGPQLYNLSLISQRHHGSTRGADYSVQSGRENFYQICWMSKKKKKKQHGVDICPPPLRSHFISRLRYQPTFK